MSDELRRIYPGNYDAHARTVPADAYWNQVRRTIKGQPIDDVQIQMIVQTIALRLALDKSDVVLDLACGNGALSSYLFDKCAKLLGIDISPYLIEIARKDFSRAPDFCFEVDDVVRFVSQRHPTQAFTKVLIYASAQYFPKQAIPTILDGLRTNFPAVKRIFVGNLPNRLFVHRFYGEVLPSVAELADHESRVGVWYTPEEIVDLAKCAGWRSTCSFMPDDFYLSSHRFDVTLDRA